jgi:long-chain acyl-CoA synthetase
MSLTYRQLELLTDAFAAALVNLGLRKGDRVIVSLPNIPQFVLVYFAILKAGGVVVAINPAYKEQEVIFHVTDSGAEMVICLEMTLPLFQSIFCKVGLKTIILTKPEDAYELSSLSQQLPLGENIFWLISLLAQFKGVTRPLVNVTGDDPAVFQYTGGTTGTPKAAIGLHRSLVANINQFSAWLKPVKSGQAAVLAAIPLFHVFGMVIAMGVAILFEAVIILVPNPRDLKDLFVNIEENKVTIIPVVPNLLFNMNQFLRNSDRIYNLVSLRLCISGSAPLLRHIKDDFEQLTGARVVEGYGLSEAPTALTCNPVLGENRAGTIGLPLPDVDCRIVSLDDGETVLGAGKVGELVARSPQLMAGYHNRPDETLIVMKEDWLFTGDVAFMDEDGYFTLIDRKKDVIKVSGFQVWPREVEDIIASHSSVMEVGVKGIMHPDYGETVKAWVVIREGKSLTADEVINWCKDRLADYKAPRIVQFVSSLPRSAVGKILRRELEQFT